MKKLQLLLLLSLIGFSLVGCGQTMDISKMKPEDRFNPAIGPAQREHMAHRGPK